MPTYIQVNPDGYVNVTADGYVIVAATDDPCCCEPGEPGTFYWAWRCDVFNGQPDPTIPPEIPPTFLLPAPFHCGGETCEIDGGRIVLYRGRCYRIVEAAGTQPEPCQDRTLARRWRTAQFSPEPPPIIDPAEVVCKPRGATCDAECIPEAPPGSCCVETAVPACAEVDPDLRACTPCNDDRRCVCGHRWYIAFRWGAVSTEHSPVGFFGTDTPCRNAPLVTIRTSGTATAVYECDDQGGYRVLSVEMQSDPEVEYFPETACFVPPGTPRPLTLAEMRAADDAFRQAIEQAQLCGRVPALPAAWYGGQFAVDAILDPPAGPGAGRCRYDSASDPNWNQPGRSTGSFAHTCNGGSFEWNTENRQADGVLRGTSSGQVAWSFGTLIRCPGSAPLIGGMPDAPATGSGCSGCGQGPGL